MKNRVVLALMGLSSEESAYAIDTTTVNEKWGKTNRKAPGGLSEAKL